jgi:hypothetical protein
MLQDQARADRFLWAINQWQENRPRTRQVTLGPSSLGGCREYIRATLAEDEGLARTERGLDGAAVGTLLGEGLEPVFESELGFLRQVETRTSFPELGLVVAGNADLVETEDEGWVGDLKSVDGLEETRRQGPSLKYWIQVSTYTFGLVQAGVLTAPSASLIYYDRSGSDKSFLVYTISWDEILGYIALAEQRLQEVIHVLEAGSPEEMRWQLRDEEPSFCHYIQCPFRMNCWGGSDWLPGDTIESADGKEAVDSYVKARQAAKDAETWKKSAREGLRGRQGIAITETGKWAVSWKGPEGRERLDVLPL